MQSISTKNLPWTQTKPARTKATAAGGASLTITGEGEHVNAAQQLKDQLDWRGVMYGGHTREGMVFVFSNAAHMLR